MSEIERSGSRHKSREMAVQLLFQAEFLPGGLPAVGPEAIARFVKCFDIEASIAGYGIELFEGVAKSSDEVDRVIESASANWRIARMAAVDRAILRIAVFEMLLKENRLPPEIVINEAVEVAKKYGGTETYSFVNGILEEIAKRNSLFPAKM